MQRFLFFIAITVSMQFVCKSKPQSDRTQIFSGLSKSYILNKKSYRDEKDFFEEFKINNSIYSKDSIAYHQAMRNLIASNVSIIGELLKFENNMEWSLWIKTASPYSATLDSSDLLSKSVSAVILIDNYILNSSIITIRPYIYKINYSWLKNWYKEGKSRDDLFVKYKVYVKGLE